MITNRKALYEYEVLQRFEAGIVLTGTEVKSLRAGKVNLMDAYALFPSRTTSELVLIGLHIAVYEFGNRENHEPTRPRRLLLHQRELTRLRAALEEKGLSLVPLSVYFSGPYIKVELGLVRGKKLYDKRASIKEREHDRAVRRRSDED
ncbi:MAG: SsrA-binding protein SmpB [Candidatus Kapabacteria bacterium]|nr:SsrA-binding protein SmpB [Candidatus Kapabacteria bacterium]